MLTPRRAPDASRSWPNWPPSTLTDADPAEIRPTRSVSAVSDAVHMRRLTLLPVRMRHRCDGSGTDRGQWARSVPRCLGGLRLGGGEVVRVGPVDTSRHLQRAQDERADHGD